MGTRQDSDYESNMARHTQLGLYLKSEGFRLPTDIASLVRGGDESTMCAFCSRPHDHVPIYQYMAPPDASTSVITGAHCCDDCYYDVHNMEKAFVGFSPRESLISDESWTPQKRREEYSSNGHFDDTVHYCYQHVTIEGLAPFKDKCYFCQQDTQEDHTFVEVPVSTSGKMTGGFVRMCHSCKRRMEESKMSFDITRVSQLKAPSDECARCGHWYLVTNDEYQNRVYLGNLNQHHCPKCTYIRCTTHAGDVLIKHKNNVLLRHAEVVCQYCSQLFKFDKTYSFNRSHEYIVNSKAACLRCREEGSPPVYAARMDDCFVRVFKRKKEDKYRITVVNVGSEKERVYLIEPDSLQDFISRLVKNEYTA